MFNQDRDGFLYRLTKKRISLETSILLLVVIVFKFIEIACFYAETSAVEFRITS